MLLARPGPFLSALHENQLQAKFSEWAPAHSAWAHPSKATKDGPLLNCLS